MKRQIDDTSIACDTFAVLSSATRRIIGIVEPFIRDGIRDTDWKGAMWHGDLHAEQENDN